MTKQAIRSALVTATCVMIAASCTTKQQDEGGGAAVDPSNPSGGPGTYIMTNEEINKDGCFNLEKAVSRMRAFPAGTIGRQFTTDIKVTGASRSAYADVLVKGNFEYKDVPFSELLEKFNSVRQTGCQSLTEMTEEGSTDEFTIIESSPTHLVIKQGENTSKLFRYIDTQTLEIEKNHLATSDSCTRDNKPNVFVKTVYKWGGAELISATQESVSADLIERMKKINAKPGEELQEPAPEVAATPTAEEDPRTGSTPIPSLVSMAADMTTVSVAELKQLKDAQIDPDLLACQPPKIKAVPAPAPTADPNAAPTPEIEDDNHWGDHPEPTDGDTPARPTPTATPNP